MEERTKEEWQKYLQAATSLQDLLHRLQKADEEYYPYEWDEGDLDWSALPTFGGDAPSDTGGIWSWDEKSLLMGPSAHYLEIIPREEAE